jgi:hypothetical protein
MKRKTNVNLILEDAVEYEIFLKANRILRTFIPSKYPI